jgi:dihydrofolate synthase/folylpolyglutamate synthase
MKFGLETTRALAREMGHPERAHPTLLVAGTNGKGSVVAYVDAALRASGLRVGRYTSPHLVRINERIAVGGREIGDAALDRAILRVRAAAERLVRRRVLEAHPTYFEGLTLAAFDHFRAARVQVAVLEVGLGGRLDATNVSEPLCSAIVSIGRDHEQYLGTTLASIAREKAGVLRPGRPAVIGAMPAAARRAIEKVARRLGARLVDASRTPRVLPPGLLPGEHQSQNARVALRLLQEARRAGLRVDLRRAPRAFAKARWPGRLQWLRAASPPLLLDGAHNPDGVRALARYLRGRGPFTLVFGVMADKSVAAMARSLFPLARAVVLTRAPGSRAASPEAIARAAGVTASDAHLEPSVPRALRLAARLTPPGGFVVVAGSLYLVGDVLRRRSAV